MSFSSPPAQVRTVGRKHFVWGLEWRLLPPEQALSRTLRTIQQEGYAWVATSSAEDILGISKDMVQPRLTMYSAALHLAERFSQGTLELFALSLGDGECAVFALNDYRPIPGFDFIGPVIQAQALIDEFEAIQTGQKIRRLGNSGMLKEELPLNLLDVMSDPSSDSSLRRLYRNWPLKWTGAVGLAIVVAMVGAHQFLNKDTRPTVDANTQASKPQPNYRAKTVAKLQSLGPSAQTKLQTWMNKVRAMPAQHQGWSLSSVECVDMQCQAIWQRQYGSAQDFFQHLPNQAQSAKEVINGNDRLSNSIATQHQADVMNAVSPWSLDALPPQTDGSRQMSSWLQDMSLLGNTKVTLDNPQIWGAEGDPASLNQALMTGTWSLTLDLDLSSVLQIPRFAQINKVKLDLASHSIQIAGDYYVQADKP